MTTRSFSREPIDRTATTIDDKNNVTKMATRLHGALVEYFDGEDPTGPIKSASTDVYAAFITVLRDEGIDGFRRHHGESPDELRARLETTFKNVGFTGPGGRLSLPARQDYRTLPEHSVGPLLPVMIAVLEEAYEIDSNVAVQTHL